MFISHAINYLPLTPWQQKQAAMLSYYSSLDYLIGLHQLVTDFINGTVESVLDQAKSQNRDAVLKSKRWGSRDTAKNWSNHAWPFLKDLQASLAEKIAQRASGIYRMSGVYECLRGAEQFSTDWMTPREEYAFKAVAEKISDWARPLDLTLSDQMSNDWKDYNFAYRYPVFAAQFSEIPRYQIRADIVSPSGTVPKQTGVYISKNDPYAALQFAWCGTEGRELRNAITFNELGLAALAAVGREDLWFNAEKMFEFATTSRYAGILRDDVIWTDGPHPDLAPAAVARKAFTERASEWYLVEPIEGVFDNLADLDNVEPVEQVRRIAGGEKCIEPGFYFAPSMPNSRRYLAKGEVAPAFASHYGETFWQWDGNQG